jgi:hypothetical protein
MSETLDYVVLTAEHPMDFEKKLNQWKEYYLLTFNKIEFSSQGNINAVITRYKREDRQ